MKKKRKWKGLLLICLFFTAFLLWNKKGGEAETASNVEAEEVKAQELAGYLQIVPLDPQETRQLILPELNDVLTGADVSILFEKLGLAEAYEKIASLTEVTDEQQLTRAQWSEVYEAMLDLLGMRDQVVELDIQYLGDVVGEERIRTDSGNYDCDPDSVFFSYGNVYTVYLYGNTILGRKDVQNEDTIEESADQETVDTTENQIQQTSDNQSDEPNSGTMQIPESVRVLVTQDQEQKIYRSDVWVMSPGGLIVTPENQNSEADDNASSENQKSESESNVSGESSDNQSYTAAQDEVVSCKNLFSTWNTTALRVQPASQEGLYLTDASGNQMGPFRGEFFVYQNDSGSWVVNELGLEDYLYGVVPGEMPESFEPEALKAQAVCARTYACRQIAEDGYAAFFADLDDTTNCQVYRPDEENAKAVLAVDDTAGQILLYQDTYAQIYYFSTSCGYTSGLEVWGQEEVSYLKKVSLVTQRRWIQRFEKFIKNTNVEAYDSHSRFFRWTATLDLAGNSDTLRNEIQQVAKESTGRLTLFGASKEETDDCSGFGMCTGIEEKERSKSGMVTDLYLIFEQGSVHIYNENSIRSILGCALVSIQDKNQNSVNDMTMLPSAAFVAEMNSQGTVTLYGGGLGHGIGMSQYGADGMAKAGMTYDEILEIFFEGTQLSGK
jgi:SpoIID/LytB domain protein